jgi:hypothetical protein
MIHEILSKISAERSTNEKMKILAKYEHNLTLKKVLYKGMSKRIKFWVKYVPVPYAFTNQGELNDLDWALDKLSFLESRTVTGNYAQTFIGMLLGKLNPRDAEVITRIIKKDLKIGMGITNVNKVFNGLLETTPYMGCCAFSEKTARSIVDMSGGYVQTKMDGRYCNSIVRNHETELESRGGEPSYLDGAQFLKELSQFPDHVFNGELTMDEIAELEIDGDEPIMIDGKETTLKKFYGTKCAKNQNQTKEK